MLGATSPIATVSGLKATDIAWNPVAGALYAVVDGSLDAPNITSTVYRVGIGGAQTARVAVVKGAVSAMTFDTKGDLFLNDFLNGVVREVSPTGASTVFAGRASGSGTPSGDGGPALKATFADLGGIAADTHGNVYIGDGLDTFISPYSSIRRVTPDGTIETWFKGSSAVPIESEVHLIATPGGSVYASDGDGGNLINVDAAGHVTTLLEVGQGSLKAIALDATGNLWAVSAGALLEFAPDGTKTTVAAGGKAALGNGGPVSDASFGSVMGMAFGPDGSLYLATNFGIRSVSPGSSKPVAPAGTAIPGATPVTLSVPGNAYILSAPTPEYASDRGVIPLAADGSTVAVETSAAGCTAVSFWDPLAGRSETARDACPKGDDIDVALLAVSGDSAYWMDQTGSDFTCAVWSASLDRPARVGVPLCKRKGEDQIDSAAGSDGVYAAVSETEEFTAPIELSVIENRAKPRVVATGNAATRVFDADPSGFLVQRSDGKLVELSPTGTPTLVLPFADGTIAAGLLRGTDVFVATHRELALLNAATGATEVTRRIPDENSVWISGYEDGVAAYTYGRRVVLVRMSDGKQLSFTPAASPTWASLTSAGLFYAVAAGNSTRLDFVPLTQIESAVR